MLKKTLNFIVLVGLLGVGITCKKENPLPARGNISLQVSVFSNSIPLSNARVYLKGSAIEFPGDDTLLYTFSESSNIFGKAKFDTLFTGNYYLYSLGFNGVDTVMGLMAIVLGEGQENSTVTATLALSK